MKTFLPKDDPDARKWHVIDANGVIEVNHVKERLHMITTKILGEEKVRDVLLQAIQQRPV